ncbi:MAG: hypothetical protein ACI8ZB_004919 [Desulforhopalus sp.]|jgi:hypothetical protein
MAGNIVRVTIHRYVEIHSDAVYNRRKKIELL